MKLAIGMIETQVYRHPSRGYGAILLMAFALGLLAGSELALLVAEFGG